MIPLVRELQLFPFERAIIQPVDPQPVIVHALLVTEELETVVTVLAARVVNRPLEGGGEGSVLHPEILSPLTGSDALLEGESGFTGIYRGQSFLNGHAKLGMSLLLLRV